MCWRRRIRFDIGFCQELWERQCGGFSNVLLRKAMPRIRGFQRSNNPWPGLSLLLRIYGSQISPKVGGRVEDLLPWIIPHLCFRAAPSPSPQIPKFKVMPTDPTSLFSDEFRCSLKDANYSVLTLVNGRSHGAAAETYHRASGHGTYLLPYRTRRLMAEIVDRQD